VAVTDAITRAERRKVVAFDVGDGAAETADLKVAHGPTDLSGVQAAAAIGRMSESLISVDEV
jgi:glutamate 5-kinase